MTTDANWSEPRGPHLPDVFRVLPVASWLFVVLALARLAVALRDPGAAVGMDPWRVGQIVLFGMPSIASILFPAAVLARHRDAWSRLRTLLLGTVLLAGVEGLRLAGTPLEPLFEQLTPGDPSLGFLVPSAVAFQLAANLLGATAVAVAALGLERSRRFDDRSGSWPVAGLAAVLVVLVAVTGIVSVSHLSSEQLPLTPTVVVYIVATVVLNVISAAAFGYLTTTVTAGARAGEDPVRGWRAAAFGSWLVIGSLAALGLLGLVPSSADSTELLNDVFLFVQAVFSLGFLALLGGFALGLPQVDVAVDAVPPPGVAPEAPDRAPLGDGEDPAWT